MILPNLLYRLYPSTPYRLKRPLRNFVSYLEGGEFYSQTLRRICADFHNVVVGLYSYGGCFDMDNMPKGTRIGRYGSFASFNIYPRNHPLDHISTHPFFYNSKLGYIKNDVIEYTKLHIGHDVWIGDYAIVTPNVKEIGNGAVIGAGAVVTKDVAPYAVVVGNPGRIVNYRFSDEIIEKLGAEAWWEKDISSLSLYIDKFVRPYSKSISNE